MTTARLPEAVRAPDLEKVLQERGPFLSAYIPTEGNVENAAQRSLQHWTNIRRDLEAAGAPGAVLEEIEGMVPSAHEKGGCLAVFAVEGGILHREHGPEGPHPSLASWDPLARLSDVIRWRQEFPPHVAVLADRRGADIYAYRYASRDLHLETRADRTPERKVDPGGWSQRRYQQRAENAWEDNAKEIAAQVARLVDAVEAKLLLIAGDVRTTAMLEERLPTEVRDLVQPIEGGRAADGSQDAIEEDVSRLVDVAVAQETAQTLAFLEQEAGQGDLAAQGVSDVLGALQRAQVEVLLIPDGPDDERRAWFGPEPTHVAVNRKDLEVLGVDRPLEDRLVDVAIRSALGTGAGIRIIPDGAGVREDFGALLRYPS